jgi:hypothetical protein
MFISPKRHAVLVYLWFSCPNRLFTSLQCSCRCLIRVTQYNHIHCRFPRCAQFSTRCTFAKRKACSFVLPLRPLSSRPSRFPTRVRNEFTSHSGESSCSACQPCNNMHCISYQFSNLVPLSAHCRKCELSCAAASQALQLHCIWQCSSILVT